MNSTSGSRTASQHNEKGGTHGLAFIFWLFEQPKWLIALVPGLVAALLTAAIHGFAPLTPAIAGVVFVVLWIGLPLTAVLGPLLFLVYRSYAHDTAAPTEDWTKHITFKDPSAQKAYAGKKVPMQTLYDGYMDGKIDFTGDVYETLLRRNRMFRFCFTGDDVRFYVRDFLGQNMGHSVEADHGDIAHVYNRGNDFYNWFLGPRMIYTSGIYRDVNDTLEDAQDRKLATVCQYVQMQPGDKHLDIGCGWGTLVAYAAKHHGTSSTGVTLAKEQAEWARATAEREGVSDRVRLIVDDYRNIPDEKFDKITCLEMAEHVGIRNFQNFLLQVRNMLKDDGMFYLQIAGLRRAWVFEDLVWGLFMGKYIFPGADASCPIGFVTTQAERAGFEVHRVENCGVHYSLTIKAWYDNWMKNEAAVVAKYGQRWFRMWAVFLSWSAIIAAQGTSTVFMVTLHKNTPNDKCSVSKDEAGAQPFDRTHRWVGQNPVATQQ
jgi:cyclopropane fatty-acyl-phospholipid synthase-like methyltransferase